MEGTVENSQFEDNDDGIICKEIDQRNIEQPKSNQSTIQEGKKKSQHIIQLVSDSFSKSHPIYVPCLKQKKQEHTTEFTVRRSKRSKKHRKCYPTHQKQQRI